MKCTSSDWSRSRYMTLLHVLGSTLLLQPPEMLPAQCRLQARTLTKTARCITNRRRDLHISRICCEREKFDPTSVERPSDEVDVCIVGGGPAGLSAAIRLKQLEQENGKEIRVVVLEKASEVGKSTDLVHVFGWLGLVRTTAPPGL